jgi:hypothetical protein
VYVSRDELAYIGRGCVLARVSLYAWEAILYTSAKAAD